MGYDGFSCGWAIGTQGWRRELAREHAHLALRPGSAADEARELRKARWREVLGQQLRSAGRTQEHAQASAKTAAWKLHVTRRVRDECGAAITRLARELELGIEGTARSLLGKLRRAEKQLYSAPFFGRFTGRRSFLPRLMNLGRQISDPFCESGARKCRTNPYQPKFTPAMRIELTEHVVERARQRLGWSEGALARMTDRVLHFGLGAAQTTGALRRYL